MARISLRAYNREIEGMIETQQLNQAIAHCQHILRYFPKHINTYRLLGKAFLESQRYGDAADIFQRVLSSVPDDFVSQVGMSIIREDEGNLDEAIWHMERAFDAQPANGAIQRELSRLFGRRDGLEPPKVRLTRGALARMYIKGELYPQAISEIRAALTVSPQRYDLLVLLAQAYYHAGQNFDAAEVCAKLLKSLPYCLEANYLLGEILSDSDRVSEASTYQKRAQALDPYIAHLTPSMISVERVADSAVVLEKMVWTPDSAPQQPAWASSLGVDLDEVESDESDKLPDWLTDEDLTVEGSLTEDTAAPQEEPESDLKETPTQPLSDELIPSWMEEAGWSPSTSEVDESISQLDEEIPPQDETLAPADIPNWLQEIAPEDQEFEAEGGTGEKTDTEPVPSMPKSTGSLPWLEDADSESETSESAWLQEDETPIFSKADTDESVDELDLPDWLSEVEKPVESIDDTVEEPSLDLSEKEVVEEFGVIPPNIKAMTDAASDGSAEDNVIEGEDLPRLPTDELPDWLSDLETSGEQGVTPQPEDVVPQEYFASESEEFESLPQQDTLPVEELPEWLEEPSITPKQAEITEETEPDTSRDELPEQDVSPEEEEAFAWLEGLAEKQGAEDALLLSPEDRRETPPEWVRDAISEETPISDETPETEPEVTLSQEELIEESVTEPQTQTSKWLPEETYQDSEEVTSETISADDIPDWLRQEYEQTPPDSEAIEEVPEWLSQPTLDTETVIDTQPISPEEMSVPQQLEPTDIVEEISDSQMLFGPSELSVEQPPVELTEKLEIDESPIIQGDTAPTKIQEGTEPTTEEVELSEALVSEAEESPQETPDMIPEWLQGLVEDDQLVTEEHPTDLPEVVTSKPEIEEDQEPKLESTEDEETAFAWLESLAVKQGTDEALLLEPEQRLDEPPEWVQAAIADEVEQASGETQVTEDERMPELTLDVEQDIAPADKHEEPMAEQIIQSEAEVESQIVEEEAVPELPQWLEGVEPEPVSDEDFEWQPATESDIPIGEQPAAQELEGTPVQIDINQAGLSELERIPGIGFIKAQAILEFREVNGSFTNIDDIQDVPGIGPVLLDEIRDLITVGAMAEEESLEPFSDDQIILMQARNAMVSGEINQALDLYNKLLPKENFHPELINDLNEALYRFPVDIKIWILLGDTFARSNQLAEALSAYIKAEELLR